MATPPPPRRPSPPTHTADVGGEEGAYRGTQPGGLSAKSDSTGVVPAAPRHARTEALGLAGGSGRAVSQVQPSRAQTPQALAATQVRGSERPLGLAQTQADQASTSPNNTQSGELWMREGGQILQYELIRELGRGGMGTVWLARDTRLGRRVAIKFLSLSDPLFRDRFLVEARATAQCQHDNIVVIHEVNEFEGTPLMVLEFLEGRPLAEHVEGRLIPAPRAIEYVIPVVRALVKAHAEGLAHRDLKPDNIFVTDYGTVKVLDFGIAKLFHEHQGTAEPQKEISVGSLKEVYQTVSTGSLVGTLPYMSPEQWGVDRVDHRTDIWAVGVILFEMVTGRHPVEPLTMDELSNMALHLDRPLPSVKALRPDVPDRLVAVIDRCLAKRKEERFPTADDLLRELLEISPANRHSLSDGQNPYPGLAAFQESDAGRFFGRERDVARATAQLQDKPLLAVVGTSGVGKSSFVRAGILPALKAQGEDWESLVVRPGRSPLDSLASKLLPLVMTLGQSHVSQEELGREHARLAQRLLDEPGYLGSALRARAQQRGAKYLLFVDQLEELYTLVEDEKVRAAFTRCLTGVADDASAPVRVVVSIRSDLLDRVAEDSVFQTDVTKGLILLAPPDSEGLYRAVTEPPAMLGVRFEDDAIPREMVESLQTSSGSLPLLQFAAAKLWERRDQERRVMTRAAFVQMGGIGGALASHADEVLGGMSPDLKNLTRTVFQRLVSPVRTRAILDMDEVRQLHARPKEAEQLVQLLSDARLVVIQSGADGETGATIEVVHESLIGAWPTLRRWLDESQEDAAFVAQLRSAAKQWDARGRDKGLLWRGEALDEAVRFQKRYQGALAEREHAYLTASVQLATRSARIRRGAVVGVIAFLSLLVAAGSVALVAIRTAEKEAVIQAQKAKDEATRARSAEATVTDQLRIIKEEEAARLKAEREALAAIQTANLTREELEQSYAKVQAQLLLIRKKEEQRLAAEAKVAGVSAVVSDAQAKVAASEKEAEEARQAAKMNREELEVAYAKAAVALKEANGARQLAESERQRAQSAVAQAESAKKTAQAAKAEADALLAKERARTAQLQAQQGKIATELK